MRQIDFHFNVANRIHYACRLTAKVVDLGKTVAVWCDDPATLSEYDVMLWTFNDMSFIPHAYAGTEEASQARVVMAGDLAALPASDVLLMLSQNPPRDHRTGLARFDRGADIVPSSGDGLDAARRRYRFYRGAGYELKNYDIGKKSNAGQRRS